ncbi:proline--tRNA ligase [Phtheirospermum japonicum]|uniref:proline--tRNA ligase n=1 Tax=Phtheirospermum japonicum TaxID=374723 RepID=A0A830BX64_9LAMI|nr:proline--tRNA ligase [Phtheirospermum japonicum]
MGALRLPTLTSLSSAAAVAAAPRLHFCRRIRFPLRRIPAANFSAQSSTVDQEIATPPPEVERSSAKPKIHQEKDRVITPRSQDFNAWYLDIIANAELADYGPVRGTMVIRPYGYAIWEAIQEYLNVKFKETGHSNMYFPQFIPYSFIEKEASHVEGFSPELALVTIGGGKELEEKLVWANVTRWEMRTKPFVRTLEFLWQEGHTAHATPEEAENEALQMIGVYTKFAFEQAAIPVIAGRKSKVETFAGAAKTYTIEAMMGDRKALQAGTSHNLGQNFSRAFGTQFTDENGERQHVWQTSWAVSTRFVGGIIMTHGDDTGLMLPPNLAPVQVIVVPIYKKADERSGVLDAASSVKDTLQAAGIRVKIDDSEQRTPGWKYNFWEMKGVPLRIEIGPRDVSSASVVVSRRDIPGKQGKVFGISMEPSTLVAYIKSKLDEVQSSLLEKAISFRDRDLRACICKRFMIPVELHPLKANGHEALGQQEELKVKEETGATIRCFPFEQPQGTKRCLMTGDPADESSRFASDIDMETNNNNTCNVNNHLDADALLPPRKRLLAGLKRQNSDVTSPSPSKNDTCLNNNNNNNPFLPELSNSNLSIEEIVEASRIAAIEATKIADAARAQAEEKAAKAAKAFAAAKNALDLVAILSDEIDKKEKCVKKNKMKKHVTVEELYNKKNKGNTNSRTDEELARNLHRAINSSPRISKNSDTKSHNKHKKMKSSGFAGRVNICSEIRNNGNGVVENLDAEGLNTSKPDRSEDLDNGERGRAGKIERVKLGNSEVLESFGRKRGRIKQKKLPLSICSFRDQTGPREELKSKGSNQDSFSSGSNLVPDERASTSLWKCQSFKAPTCVKQNKVMQL